MALPLLFASHLGISLCAYALWRPTRSGSFSSDLLWFLVLRWSAMSALVLALGSLRRLGALELSAASVLLGTLAAIRWRRELLVDWNALRARLAGWTSLDPALKTMIAAGGALAGLALLRTLVGVWILAPYGGDATGYHLPKLAAWVQSGSLDRPPFDDLRMLFPGGFQVLQVWWVLFTHHDALIEMTGVEFLLFGAAAAYAAARETGLSRPAAGLAALLFGTLPVNLVQATACTNDLAITGLSLAVLAFALRRDAALVLATAALAASIKPTIAYVLPVAFVLVLRRPATSTSASPANVAALLVPVAVGLYWYLRNAAEFGNPIYPAGVSLLGWRPFNEAQGVIPVTGGPTVQQTEPALSSLRLNVSEFLQYRLYDAWLPFGSLTVRQAGWGWLGMSLAMPSLLLAIRHRALPARVMLSFAAAFLLTLSAVDFDVRSMRFIAWCAALPCIAVPVAVGLLGTAARRAVLHLIIVGTAMNIVGSFSADGLHPDHFRRALASADRSSADYVRPGFHSRPGMRAEPVAFAGFEYPIYALYGPDFARPVVVVPWNDVARTRPAVRYLVVGVVPPRVSRELDELVRRGELTKIDDELYEIRGRP